MGTDLLDLTVLPQKLPNINDPKKRPEHGKCALLTFLEQCQPQALSRKSVAQCVCLVILVHFSHLKPCICLATAGAFHKGFNSSAVYKEPFPFVCVERTTCSLHLLSLSVPNPPFLCYPGFQSFLIHTLNSVFNWSSGMHPYSRCGGQSLPLVVSVAFSGFAILLNPFNEGEPDQLTLFEMQVAVYCPVI